MVHAGGDPHGKRHQRRDKAAQGNPGFIRAVGPVLPVPAQALHADRAREGDDDDQPDMVEEIAGPGGEQLPQLAFPGGGEEDYRQDGGIQGQRKQHQGMDELSFLRGLRIPEQEEQEQVGQVPAGIGHQGKAGRPGVHDHQVGCPVIGAQQAAQEKEEAVDPFAAFMGDIEEKAHQQPQQVCQQLEDVLRIIPGHRVTPFRAFICDPADPFSINAIAGFHYTHGKPKTQTQIRFCAS